MDIFGDFAMDMKNSYDIGRAAGEKLAADKAAEGKKATVAQAFVAGAAANLKAQAPGIGNAIFKGLVKSMLGR